MSARLFSVRAFIRPPRFVLVLVLASLIATLVPATSHGLTVADSGRWTPPRAWSGTAVHMALLPGYPDTTRHSEIIWWQGLTDNQTMYGGLWGWNPGDYDCTSYPSLDSLAFPLPDSSKVFCSSESGMATGELFLAGGTQPGTENGARHAYKFDPVTNSWTRLDSMSASRTFPKGGRWYATSTCLASGRQLVTSGSQYNHVQYFSGLTGTDTAPLDSAIFRYGLGYNGVDDGAIRTSPNSPWPSPREGASAVFAEVGYVFGGKDRSGNYNNEVWQLRRKDDSFAADYDYPWSPFGTLTPAPAARWEHTAISAGKDSAWLIVVGGVRKNSLGQDVVLDDVWRLHNEAGAGFQWTQVQIQSSPESPGPRWGHAAIFHAPSRRMLMFGGRSATSGAPTDSALWALNFAPGFATATWQKLSATGPSPRFDHAVSYDPLWTEPKVGQGAVDTSVVFVFGGDLGGGVKAQDLWKLHVGPDMVWRQVTLGGTPPSPRSGHTLTADAPLRTLYVFGGSATDDTVYVAHVDSPSPGAGQWGPLTRNSVALRNHTAIFWPNPIFERVPEIHDPVANSWTRLTAVPHYQDWYPQSFVWKPDTVFFAGPDTLSYKFCFNSDGASWTAFPTTSTGFKGGSAVMYRPGKVMKCGSRDTEVGPRPALHTTMRIDLNAGVAAQWDTSAKPMLGRVNHNLVLLPNGKVLVVGGTGFGGNDVGTDPVFKPEIWDPDNSGGLGGWFGRDTLAAQAIVRDYHSTALLLPDARILSASGNADLVNRKKAEIFCPPYLFKSNGSLATRPAVDGVPKVVTWGRPSTLCTANTATISRVCLIRPAAVTHGFDQNQRYVPLSYTAASNPARLLVNPPASPDSAPPGDYLLFVTGSADGADVPSIARWVRLGSTAGDDLCDAVAPEAVADLSGCYHYPFHNPPVGDEKKIDLAWTAPADDGTLAASGRAKLYDIRMSYQAINTETQFNNATPISPAPPAPAAVGTIQTHLFGNFSPNGVVYFRMKTIDDRGGSTNASAMSNQAVVYTSSDCAEGDGFFAGSGGGSGGGGLRARRVAGGASAESPFVGGGSFVENSLLEGARLGERASDLYRLAVPPRIVNGAYTVRIRAAGTRATALDAARLLVVDHPAEVTAHGMQGGAVLGALVPAARVTAIDGTDVTSLLDGTTEYVAAAGEILTVELDPASISDPGALVLEAKAFAGSFPADSTGVLVDVPDGSGGWRALDHRYPRTRYDELAVPSVSGDMVRLRFLKDCGLRFVGRLLKATEPPTVQWASLLTARSNMLGDTRLAVDAPDSLSAIMAAPDTLTLGFSVPPQAEGTVRDYFLAVEATPLTPKTALPAAPAAATKGVPASFALYQNQPNPFSARTTIRFDLPVGANVLLEVFDIQGRRLRVLTDRYYTPGRYAVEWDKRTQAGGLVGSGIYFYRIQAGPFRNRRKMILLP
jgi:galactose oxidase-like protein